jgi:hypothetical protein
MQSTDHQSVYINVIPAVSEKGRGYWKINNSILQEVEYDKSCSSFSKDLLASRLNFDLLLQYIIVASLISIFRTFHKSRQSTLLFTLS